MKKSLLIALAICLLLLGGCGSVTGTGALSNTLPTQKTTPITPIDPQFSCSVLHAQEVRLQQQIQAASARLATARRDQNTVGQVEHVLIRLHWVLAQAQAGSQGCKTT